MKKSLTIIMLALIASYATAQSTQRSEDLKSIPGTWWFMAKLDNPVDTLLIMKADDLPPTNIKTLAKNEHGVFLFYTPLTEPCNYLIFTPPNVAPDNFFDFNVHAEPGEVLSVQGCYDVNKPVYGLTFGGSRYYVDYAEAFMRLNTPPKVEDDGDIIDSILIVVNGMQLPKSMNGQLIRRRPWARERLELGSITVDEALRSRFGSGNQDDSRHLYYDYELKRDLQAYFLRSDQYVSDVKVLIDAAATAIYGRIGANGAIEITTRPFLSVAPLSPDESKARRQNFLLDVYATYHEGHVTSTGSAFGPDGFIYNGKDHAFDPDLFDTPVEEQFFGQMTHQHGHKTSEFFGPLGSDSRGIYVPLIREVEIKLPANVDQNHVDSVVNAIRQAARQADKSIEGSDSLVRMAFIFGGKVKEGKPHSFRTYPMKENGSSDIESRYYFTPDANAESSWWAEAYFKTTHPRQLVMHLVSVDKLYASDRPAILENRRHIEGTVLEDETGNPIADALVYIEIPTGISDAGGGRTDKKGHFDLWLPFQNELVRVSKSGYKDSYWIQPVDTALTIRLIPASSPKQQPSPFKSFTTIGNGVKAGDTISGTVSDETISLIGATVCEINANGRIVESAITDMNGAFKMKVINPEDRIRFSYVGMKTITVPIDKKEYKIKMEPVRQYDYKLLRRQSGSSTLPIPQREVVNATEHISMSEIEGFITQSSAVWTSVAEIGRRDQSEDQPAYERDVAEGTRQVEIRPHDGLCPDEHHLFQRCLDG